MGAREKLAAARSASAIRRHTLQLADRAGLKARREAQVAELARRGPQAAGVDREDAEASVLIDELVARMEVYELALEELGVRLVTPSEASAIEERVAELEARMGTIETAIDELIAPTPAAPEEQPAGESTGDDQGGSQ